MKRKPDEEFEEYQKRRKIDKIITGIKRLPKLVWNSRPVTGEKGRTFVRGRDQLVNSRADANKVEALKRKEKKPEPTPEHPDTEIWQQELPLGDTDA